VEITFGNFNVMSNSIPQNMSPEEILTVSELTRQIKLSLEMDFHKVLVLGEVSNLKFHTSGHIYFTLKDEQAQLSAVIWRNRYANLNFPLEDGMKIIASGQITVYQMRGIYQLEIQTIYPVGVGELQMAFERLKQKLAREGLFDASHKKPIPKYPERVGVVTSEVGAVIQDIKSVIMRRNPAIELVLYPVRVQGPGAAEEIANAILEMNLYGEVDVIIVGRGGGSLEDLWPFNEEVVARAIFDSNIPIISAVGHEIDFSISDFVADVRAATPSAAAEMVAYPREEILNYIEKLCETMKDILESRIMDSKRAINSAISSYVFNRPRDLIREYSQRMDELERTLISSYKHFAKLVENKYISLKSRLEALSPSNVLKRGYAIVRKDDCIISRAKQLHKGEEANIQFFDGKIDVKVEREY